MRRRSGNPAGWEVCSRRPRLFFQHRAPGQMRDQSELIILTIVGVVIRSCEAIDDDRGC
jgi:hypothetical protein